ncbi:hypothetical protein Ddye_000975 [Dipteronia dyeriana]|uniref:Glycosyltransferase n=1 Tax=Dipteronia dyeriana TaxID=168575 RepID=A0AAD9XML1_9ROSI|nr:hypothetical protein Ddye_000975 [Dipteronia dyeriana]
MKKDTIALYPSPGRSHLVSMIELGKLILTHCPSFTITIIISEAPFETGSTSQYIQSISATAPSIIFHHLPTTSSSTTNVDIITQSFELPRQNNSNFHQALLTISKSSNLKSLILDFFCNASFEISSTGLQIPTYYYITGNLGGLSVFLYLPTLHKNTTNSLKEVGGELINIPGWKVPISAKDMPQPMQDRTTKVYNYFLETAIQMPKSAGIIVNTVESLEKGVLNAILDGLCTPGEQTVPRIYSLGPLIVSGDGKSSGEVKHECINWLDSKPKSSVVFLSFGSVGKFTGKQLKEMALGLETSGVNFLWVVRPPPGEDRANAGDWDSLFPDGFLERIKNRGYVAKSWAPQVEVLSHESVGGFVSHCGWNSSMEAVRAGVPILAWPLYAEQKLIKVTLVEELKVALPVMPAEDGVVSAAELEKRVTELMDSESEDGKSLRERVLSARQVLLTAYSQDGPSRIALANFVESFKDNEPFQP